MTVIDTSLTVESDTITTSLTVDGDAVTATISSNPRGPRGFPGPNEVTSATTTTFNGLLKGDGANVALAVAGTDYLTPSGASSIYLAKASNLSDLSSASTARTNLGLGNSATRSVGTTNGTVAAGDDSRFTLSTSSTTSLNGLIKGDGANLAVAIAGTDYLTPSGAATLYLAKSSNLSDLASASTARSNLGLGTAAVVNTGTTEGTVPLLGVNGSFATSGGDATITTSGEFAGIRTTGESAGIGTEGVGAAITTAGDYAPIYTQGTDGHIFTMGANAYIETSSTFRIAGGGFTTTLSGTQTANRAISFPDADGTVALGSGTNGAIVSVDVSDASFGGNDTGDSGKLLKFSPNGQITASWFTFPNQTNASGKVVSPLIYPPYYADQTSTVNYEAIVKFPVIGQFVSNKILALTDSVDGQILSADIGDASSGDTSGTAADKVAKFSASGDLSARILSAGTVTVGANGIRLGNAFDSIATIKSTNLTTDRTFEFPDAAGTLALTTSNVATATALQNSRTIFGISFNGTANVSGDATNAGHFASIPSGGGAGHFITLNGTAPTVIAGRSAWWSDSSGVPSFRNGTGGAVTLVRSSDLGTGVATALAVNVGTAGAFVVNGGALGTPSSGNLANCTFPTLNQNTTGSAATLTTPRTIFGQSFNGSANIGGGTITLANNLTTSGNFALTLTTTATTNVTLPTTGTLATLAGSETLTNKTLTTPTIANIAGTSTSLGTGSSNFVTITGSATSPTISTAGSSTNIDLVISPKGNGQTLFGGGGFTYATAASGKGSIMLNNGTTDSPGVKFVYGNASNLSFDTAPFGAFGGLATQFLRFIQNADEGGGSVVGGFDASGNFAMTGTGHFGGNFIRVATSQTPASASATGTAGTIAWDSNYIYVCTATNTWKRVAIATW